MFLAASPELLTGGRRQPERGSNAASNDQIRQAHDRGARGSHGNFARPSRDKSRHFPCGARSLCSNRWKVNAQMVRIRTVVLDETTNYLRVLNDEHHGTWLPKNNIKIISRDTLQKHAVLEVPEWMAIDRLLTREPPR